MAVIAALTTTFLDPQVAAQVIPISAGNNIRPTAAGMLSGGQVIGAPKPAALQTPPAPVGHGLQ